MAIGCPARSKLLLPKVLYCSFKHGLNNLLSIFVLPSKHRGNAGCCAMAGAYSTSTSNVNPTMHPEPRRTYQVVVAATHDMGIGKDGKLPWRLPSDLKFFKEITTTTLEPGKKNAVIMGRKTWESIPLKFRPLPNRLNVVLTSSRTLDIGPTNDVVICSSIPSALKSLAQAPYCSFIEKLFVIGGGQILREALNAPECDAIHITKIETSIECDTFIPPIDLSLYQLQYLSEPLVENGIRFSFATYTRMKDTTTGVTTACS